MPLTVPSHQGLIAPLWRRWPHVFDAPALFVGAAMPDVVEGVSIVFRGYSGQGIGHSLIGLVLFAIPGGLLLWLLIHATARRLSPMHCSGFAGRIWNAGLSAIACNPGPASFRRRWKRILFGLGTGAFSHLCIDLISHGGFPWLIPWAPKMRIYPDWWYHVFARISLPWRPRLTLITPYFLVWLSLSVLGAILLFRPACSTRPPPPSTNATKTGTAR